jgi:hypothetical protein
MYISICISLYLYIYKYINEYICIHILVFYDLDVLISFIYLFIFIFLCYPPPEPDRYPRKEKPTGFSLRGHCSDLFLLNDIILSTSPQKLLLLKSFEILR